MLNPSQQDIDALSTWANAKDPLAALADYSRSKIWLRWLKPSHFWLYAKQWRRRAEMAKNAKDLQQHYRTAFIPNEPLRWEYLKKRKAWYIAPWGWERFANPDCGRILDAGCGDGDVTARVAEYIAGRFAVSGQSHRMEITGLDLNQSRVDNAARLCRPPSPEIRLDFGVADCVTHIPFPDKHFDYCLLTGVMETLDDPSAASLARELARVSRKGVFIEDVADKFPGGSPFRNLEALFSPYGFRATAEHRVFSEPFSLTGMPDPCWRDFGLPFLLVRLIWLERAD